MGLNLNKTLDYASKHYITSPQDPINNVEKIDSNVPYVLANGIHAGTIDLNRWQTTLDAYRGIGLNRYGIYGVAEEDNTATPKFLLTADYIQSYGWGTGVPGEFRVGDNVREEGGFLVGKNYLWYSPVIGLSISGPLLRTISSDTNIILSPTFDNLVEFDLENATWNETGGYGGGPSLIFYQSGSISIKGKKTIDGAAVIRGSIMYKHSVPFPPNTTMLIEAEIYDIDENLITISSSALTSYNIEEWKRHNYILRLGPHDNADSFKIRLVVKNLEAGSYINFDTWNAYRVFQAAIESFDLPEIMPESGKSVIYDLKGIRAYWPDAQGNPQLTFELNAANGNAFFAGNMEVRGYVHSGPVYLVCNPTDPYTPTYHHEIVGCGINTYAIYGIAPNTINNGYYNVGRSKFLLSARNVQFNKDCDKWYWGDKLFAGELRVGNGLYYDTDKHDLFNPLTPTDIYQRVESKDYLWFYPGDRALSTSDQRYYPFLRIRGSMIVNGYVHSGPVYNEDLAHKNLPATIGGCGINQYAIYGIKTIGSGTSEDPYKVGESRFLVSNQNFHFSNFDPYWGDQLFEGEMRVGLNILYDESTDNLVDSLGNSATDYMWFRPSPQGSALPTKFIVKASILADPTSDIPLEAIDGVSGPEDILNDNQQWEDVQLTDVADFLKHSQGSDIQNGLVAHDNYFGFYQSSIEGDLHSWRFKVDNTGKTFIGKYSTIADRRFMYWDGSDLRIEGGLFAYKGFFKDLLYVGDENLGIEIYGGDHANSNQSKMFITDPITGDAINTPYIRSLDVDSGFSKGGWIIQNDGFASYSKISGIGRNLHLTTDTYWQENLTDGTWSKKGTNSYTGFLATYEGLDISDQRPACAIYLHDSPYNTSINNFTFGVGCFKDSDSTYILAMYNYGTTTEQTHKNVRFEFRRLAAAQLHTDSSFWSTGPKGISLQIDPNEPIGFYGATPKVRPHLAFQGSLWEEGTTEDKLNYLADCILQLVQNLGKCTDPDNANPTEGLGLFSWEYLQP